MKIPLQDPAAVINGFDLISNLVNEYGCKVGVLNDDLDLAKPEAAVEAIASQLLDGDPERVDRFGNRIITVPVRLDASKAPVPGEALGLTAAALEMALRWDGFGLFSLTPAAAGAKTSVYEVWHAEPSTDFDATHEATTGKRDYVLTLVCRPFARAVDLTTFDAPPTPGGTVPATVVWSDGSSETGYTTASQGAISGKIAPNAYGGLVSGGGTLGAAGASIGLAYAVTAAMPSSVTGWSVRIQGTYAVTPPSAPAMGTYSATFTVGGIAVSPPEAVKFVKAGAGTITVAFDVAVPLPASGVTSVSVLVSGPKGATIITSIDAISQVWTLGTLTGKVQARAVAIEGTQRTDLSLSLIGYDVDPSEFFTDPSFESGISEWSAVGTATREWSTDNPATGTHSMLTAHSPITTVAATTAIANCIQSKAFAVTAGKSYTVRGSYFSNRVCAPVVRYYTDAAGTTLSPANGSGTIYIPTLFAAAQNDFSSTFIVPAGVVSVRIVPRVAGYYDDISLKAVATAIPLGAQTLVASGAKFIACRSASGASGTASDANAMSGSYNLSAAAFPLPRASVPAGDYMAYASVYAPTATTYTATLAGPDGTASTRLVASTVPIWPTIATGTYTIVPIGVVSVREATGGTVTMTLTGSGAMRIDDLYLTSLDGQVTLLDTSGTYDGHNVELVRLDAADAGHTTPRIWFGTADGSYMIQAPGSAILGFDQHAGTPGVLGIASITTGCATTRLAGSLYKRFGTHVA
ncbi:hypothetical protein [Nocardioides sp.]|uniref:hypothetical protein n=1 Tax=Nocardioides sp. TaxID=35761 RepID=UPI002612680E|nr:hypothetical protein [Nocardioides sp.]